MALRRGLFNSVALIPSVYAAAKEDPTPEKPGLIKPSELPIYEKPHSKYHEHEKMKSQPKCKEPLIPIQETLKPGVKIVREQAQEAWKQTAAINNYMRDVKDKVVKETSWIVNYLREEASKEQRQGAVVMGGLTGYILALRGGLMKKFLYTGFGTGFMGYICYPEETNKILNDSVESGRNYINIIYNFVYGVKPGDPQLKVRFPDISLPKSFSELADLSMSVAGSIKQAVLPPPKSTDDKK